MNQLIKTHIQWIGKEFGGRKKRPTEGAKHNIRWQRYIQESFKDLLDVQIIEINSENNVVTLQFSKNIIVPSKYITSGQLIELLDAYNVVGIGKII